MMCRIGSSLSTKTTNPLVDEFLTSAAAVSKKLHFPEVAFRFTFTFASEKWVPQSCMKGDFSKSVTKGDFYDITVRNMLE